MDFFGLHKNWNDNYRVYGKVPPIFVVLIDVSDIGIQNDEKRNYKSKSTKKRK